ncbi:MAG: phosphate propanoyltransferase [bacterium]|nr:phosphate propanoyltransferase [bacterium]
MQDKINEIIERIRIREMREAMPIIVNVSNRHFHCTQQTFEKLFGYSTPKVLRNLIQPGQFAAEETITVKGPKGELHRVRLVGPVRKVDQVELSKTDCIHLGINAPVRESGDVKGSAPIVLIGPKGVVELKEGAIIAQRHFHMHPDDAKKYGVKNGDLVRALFSKGTSKETIYTVLIRAREDMALECHLDTDEANAAGVKNGDLCYMLDNI